MGAMDQIWSELVNGSVSDLTILRKILKIL
jgi:hypothetical protein